MNKILSPTKRELLAVSFGTSYPQTREKTIGAIEGALEAAFPEYTLRRAFTSRVVIQLAREREGLDIDSMDRALDRAAEEGVEELLIQPTHLLEGLEYRRMPPGTTAAPPWSSWDTAPPPAATPSIPSWRRFYGPWGAGTGLWEPWRPGPPSGRSWSG